MLSQGKIVSGAGSTLIQKGLVQPHKALKKRLGTTEFGPDVNFVTDPSFASFSCRTRMASLPSSSLVLEEINILLYRYRYRYR